jgi:hypothetical protein
MQAFTDTAAASRTPCKEDVGADDAAMVSTHIPSTVATSSHRLWQIDALRGLMLLLMTVTHLPTRLSSPLGQPFGYVSAAEGFVLLSGFMAGMVYTRKHRREGEPEMRQAFLRRVLKIYLCQAALLLFLFSAILLMGALLEQPAVLHLLSFYIEKPLAAVFGALLLVYNPPLLDILPMYIVFMLASPVLLAHGLQHGWFGILALSVVLWVGAQFGLGHWLYEAAAGFTGLAVPLQHTGAFTTLAWQFLWVMGLWMGAQMSTPGPRAPIDFPPWLVRTAIGVAVLCFVWRHMAGQVPVAGPSPLNLMFDKWNLAPLRLINLFALLVLTMHFAPWLSARLPRVRMLETLGAASLPVFCAHVVLALLALALVGEALPDRPWGVDLLVLGGSLVVLCGVALVSQAIDRLNSPTAASARLKALAARRPRSQRPGQRGAAQ